MKNNESGEFELVLGNRQLLSGFFIIVILFGVFFTMGYIVGRNSRPSPRLAAETATPGHGDVQSEGRPQPALGNLTPPAESPTETAAAGKPDAQEPGAAPEPVTQPARQPEPAKTAEAPAETPQPEPAAARRQDRPTCR